MRLLLDDTASRYSVSITLHELPRSIFAETIECISPAPFECREWVEPFAIEFLPTIFKLPSMAPIFPLVLVMKKANDNAG